jgi:putative proteasome-type protease
MLLRDGLVMIADTRTNAGLDNVSVFRKLRVFGTPGERVMGLASAGNLSVSQSVVSTLNEGIKNPATGTVETLTNVPTMFQAVQLIGRAIRQVHVSEGRVPEQADPTFSVSFLFGGEIRGDRLRLFMVYPEGNSIECTVDTPYLQIGEHKYGKPVLDRAITYGIDLYTALKIGLISVDSTMRSNLGVGLPLDVLVVKRGAFDADLDYRVTATEPYYRDLRDSWSKALRNAQTAIPVPPYRTAAGRRLAPAILTDIDPEDGLEASESMPPRLSSVKGS